MLKSPKKQLRSGLGKRNWTAREIAQVLKLGPGTAAARQLAEKLGRSVAAIQQRRSIENIRRNGRIRQPKKKQTTRISRALPHRREAEPQIGEGFRQNLLKLLARIPEDSIDTAINELSKLIPADPDISFDFGSKYANDYTKRGLELYTDVEPLSGKFDFDLISVIGDISSPENLKISLNTDELCERAVQLDANLGQRDGEKLIDWLNNEAGSKDSKRLRPYRIPLTGTVWITAQKDTDIYYLTYICFDDGWCLKITSFDTIWISGDRFLVPRRKNKAG